MTAPDGRGLPDEVHEIIRNNPGMVVHLRLTSHLDHFPQPACDRGLGEWWTGKASEVTCPACLEVVHS